jgi:ATP-dependent Clp protease adaptor protein ClpS
MSILFGTELENEVIEKKLSKKAAQRSLIIYNDDYNTFDFVIESLVDVCGHDLLQAEQCTFIIHFNGKCEVKRGSFEDLKPLKDALIDRTLSAVIE